MRLGLIGLFLAAAIVLSPLTWADDAGETRFSRDAGLTDFERCMMLDCPKENKP